MSSLSERIRDRKVRALENKQRAGSEHSRQVSEEMEQNVKAYEQLKGFLLESGYKGEFALICNGLLWTVASRDCVTEAVRRARKENPETQLFVHEIGEPLLEVPVEGPKGSSWIRFLEETGRQGK